MRWDFQEVSLEYNDLSSCKSQISRAFGGVGEREKEKKGGKKINRKYHSSSFQKSDSLWAMGFTFFPDASRLCSSPWKVSTNLVDIDIYVLHRIRHCQYLSSFFQAMQVTFYGKESHLTQTVKDALLDDMLAGDLRPPDVVNEHGRRILPPRAARKIFQETLNTVRILRPLRMTHVLIHCIILLMLSWQ